MSIKIKDITIDSIQDAIREQHDEFLLGVINELYAADIAEVMDELNLEEAKYLYTLLEKEEAAEVLMELEDDVRERFLASFSTQEIAHEFIDNLDSDDAADLINELPDTMRGEILAHIEDRQQAQDIADLLIYPTNSAGGLMGKELVKVHASWHVVTCIREMRRQAEEVENVYTVYVVDDDEKLVGMLSLEKLLIASPRDKIETLFDSDVISVKATQKGEEVAQIMNKYDLVVLPVIDELGRLIGRITIDDVVDFIKEEAERDYQLMSGITQDIESTDKIWEITQGRLFWLVVALFGGIIGSRVIANYEDQISINPELAFFMPLIAAMGGNVGIQSSALIVQGLANHTLSGGIFPKLMKELSVGLINGLVCSAILMVYSYFFAPSLALGLTVSVALMTVIIFASVFGSFVPLVLEKMKIDPALATGPFITTSNDIIGLFIYFMIGRLMYGFF
ncbi:MAG: magnesium transporter [Bacteroidales bacterium]|jgi:magnesium transporter|nr:magnesium transporter [Bacteroidales bacterium]NLM93150.1 magnesium transporter [Bacteroidales bacterium]